MRVFPIVGIRRGLVPSWRDLLLNLRDMKFTDGQWLLQPGIAAHYAAEAYAIDVRPDQLVVLATTRPIKHRGDTLQGPTLTVTITSPLEGVVRVAVEHFAASEAPRLH